MDDFPAGIMRKHRFYQAALVTALSVSFILAQSLPAPKPLSDEEQIRLLLIDLEQGIKCQNLLRLMRGFSESLEYGDSTVTRGDLKARFQSMFNMSNQRREDSLFQALTPVEGDLTGTWDFELEIDTLRFFNDHAAQVKAWVYFGASPPDTTSDWQFGKRHRENIMVSKIGEEWRMKKVDKLFEVLSKLRN